jgi:glycosyltransferase involved in cell wall biosynthesis
MPSHISRPEPGAPHLVWVYPEPPASKLDAATWLETTRELRHAGWRVTLLAQGAAGPQRINGVELFGIPNPPTYMLRQILFHLKILALLAQMRPAADIVLFHQMSAPWFLLFKLACLLSGGPRPLFVLDTRTVPMNLKAWKERLRGAFNNSMNSLAHYWVDGQTAITRRMAEMVGIPPRMLWGIWPSGVTQERFSPAQARRHWPAGGAALHLIYVGALHEERHLLQLCHAVERANNEGMAFVLSLVGDGRQRRELEQFASRTGGRVRVLPPVPHSEVPGLLAQAHIGVLPFPDEEKFRVSSPIKLFEYMASGLVILATRIVCHTDVVGSGEYVVWAEDASIEGLLAALRSAWAQRDTLEQMGSRAADDAAAWTWCESARKLRVALEVGLSHTRPSTIGPGDHEARKAP